MADKLPDRARRLLSHQRGIIAYWQAAPVGLSPRTIENFVRYGRWQRLQRGVYAGFTGKPPRDAQLWAAVLRAPHAVLSHESAAELDGLADGPSEQIHLTVPADQHWRPVPGVVVHRSRRIDQARHPGLDPPRTMIEETVLDLAEAAPAFDDAFAWIARACQRGLTTPALLRIRMNLRKKLRRRGELEQVLADVNAGVDSVLKYRFLRHVERAHRLPRAQRQAHAPARGVAVHRDVLYRGYGVAVELDGRAYYPADERLRDSRRDNAAAAEGIITLRYGWADVAQHPCDVAAQVSAVLRQRGWTGRPRPCGPACAAKP
jgi:very-short-patch-repair endonuclease